MLARAIDDRDLDDTQLARLKQADEVLQQSRQALAFGRGNVNFDIDSTQGDSSCRVAAARVLRDRLVNAGISLNAPQKAAIAEASQAGNCSEHADVTVHKYASKLQAGEQIHKVTHPGADHAWAELRAGDTIAMDGWGEGPAFFAEDGQYTNETVPPEQRVSAYAYGPFLAKKAAATKERIEEQLTAFSEPFESARARLEKDGYRPPSDKIWDPEPVFGQAFAERVAKKLSEHESSADVAAHAAQRLGVSVQDAIHNAEAVVELAKDLRRAPQNPDRSGNQADDAGS